ncbi:metal-dependent hydrolase domain protein [Burkholderia multivorans ATCC BAA-247]|nr:metal-dependent hydrolase domain protein [Burkholderia multivorans ATCC BAA-247]
MIASLEHFFGYLGNGVLNAHGLDAGKADPTMVDLLRWHGAEELEHRTVASTSTGTWAARIRSAACTWRS